MNHYTISYLTVSHDGIVGFGMIEVSLLGGEITRQGKLIELSEQLCRRFKVFQAVIINYFPVDPPTKEKPE